MTKRCGRFAAGIAVVVSLASPPAPWARVQRAPGVGRLPPKAAQKGGGSAIVRSLSGPGRGHAPGLSGADPEDGLVGPLPRAARGERRLHLVPLLMGEPMERRRF